MPRKKNKNVPIRSYTLEDGDLVPTSLRPFFHELGCGCEYVRNKKNGYDVQTICDEHDPCVYKDDPYNLECPNCEEKTMDVDQDGKISCTDCKPQAFEI